MEYSQLLLVNTIKMVDFPASYESLPEVIMCPFLTLNVVTFMFKKAMRNTFWTRQRSWEYLGVNSETFTKNLVGSFRFHMGPHRLLWAIYSDLSRGHPRWWFSKGIPPKIKKKKQVKPYSYLSSLLLRVRHL